jgi:type VI secretion system protein ImpH
MATQGGGTDPTLEDVLFENGYRFDFFQAVRVLERLFPQRRAVGHDAKPAQEVARFRSYLTLAFPPSQIYEIARTAGEGGPAEMTVAFMGLTGPLGVLPWHYTELLIERVRQRDPTLVEFFDLFNHRMISLFYRAWEKYRFPIGYERAVARREGTDPFSLGLFDLMGMGTKGLRGRLQVEDETFLFYAGLVAQHPRSASALEGLLTDYFAAPVQTVQFAGQWLPLGEEDRSRIGPGETNNAIGVNAVLGSRVWDQQAKFVLRVGPLAYPEFCGFLPSGTAFRPLVKLTRFFAGQEFDFDVRLVLMAAEVPWCRLGETGDRAPRLGWSTWLKTRDFSQDADGTVLTGSLTQIGALPG